MNISLKICGNPESNGGFQPILLYNNPVIDIRDRFDSGFDACSYYFSLCTEQTQAVYKLIKNNVRSYGSVRAGSLVIAIAIPRGYALDGGLSPFDALTALKDAFLQRCMTCRDALKETYEFNPGRIDSSILDDVAQRFTLTEAITPWHPMTDGAPVGCIIRPETDIIQLFRDVQYPEFEHYSEILVAEATSLNSQRPTLNIAIPRVPQYKIYVNNQHVETVSDTGRHNTYRIPETASHEGAQIAFTIAQLLNGDAFPEIQFDRAAEEVKVQLKTRTKEFRHQLMLRGDAGNAQTLLTMLTLKFRGQTKVIASDSTFTLTGTEEQGLRNEDFDISCRSRDYEIGGWTMQGGVLTVTLNVQRAPLTAHRPPLTTQPSTTMTVDLLLPIGFEFTQSMSKHALKIKVIKDGGEAMMVHTVFTKSNTVERRYHGEVLIPKSWARQSVNFASSYERYDFDSGTIVIPHPADSITVELQVMNKSFMDRFILPRMKLIMLVTGLLLGLLLGCMVGYATHDTFKRLLNPTKQKVTTTHIEQMENGEQEAVSEEELKQKIASFGETLKKEDLTFAQVEDIYAYYNQYAEQLKAIDGKFCQRVEDYKRVTDALKNNAFEAVRKDVHENKLNIEQKHRMKMFNYFIGSVDSNGKTQVYPNAERDKRITQYADIYESITSFADLIYAPQVEETNPVVTRPNPTTTTKPIKPTTPTTTTSSDNEEER